MKVGMSKERKLSELSTNSGKRRKEIVTGLVRATSLRGHKPQAAIVTAPSKRDVSYIPMISAIRGQKKEKIIFLLV